MMQEAAGEHDRRMQEALGDSLPGDELVSDSLEFTALPHGMGLTKAARVSNAAQWGGVTQLNINVWEDMRKLFQTVTGGIGNLEAESDLPFVRSLQAAMHKLQQMLFDVAKSAFPLVSALNDDFAGYLTHLPNHCPDVTVAKGDARLGLAGGVWDGGGGPDPARDVEGVQQVEGEQLALMDMDNGREGDFSTQSSEHGTEGEPLGEWGFRGRRFGAGRTGGCDW
eukprot:gene25472-biopygen26357